MPKISKISARYLNELETAVADLEIALDHEGTDKSLVIKKRKIKDEAYGRPERRIARLKKAAKKARK